MNTLLQIRIDEDLKKEAAAVYENLGMDLSTAVRLFLKKSIAVNGVPFELRNNEEKKAEFRSAIKEMNDISKKNGNSEMTLEEINEIIAETRNASK